MPENQFGNRKNSPLSNTSSITLSPVATSWKRTNIHFSETKELWHLQRLWVYLNDKVKKFPNILGFFSFKVSLTDAGTHKCLIPGAAKATFFPPLESNNLKKELEMNWSVCPATQVLWCLGCSGMLFSTACVSWHIFNALPSAGLAVADVCSFFHV